MPKDAAEGGDTDTASQYHGSTRLVIVETQVPERSFHLHFGAHGNPAQHTLESCVSQASCYHNEVFMWCARDGKPACIAFGIRFRRVQQRNIHKLSGSELEARWLFETKRHRAL